MTEVARSDVTAEDSNVSITKWHVFRRVMQRAIDRQTFALCTSATVIAAIVGPFGTYQGMGQAGSFASWFFLIYLVTLVSYAIAGMLLLQLGRAHGWVYCTLCVLLGAAVNGTLLDFVLAQGLNHYPPDRPNWIWLIFYVGSINAAVLFAQIAIPSLHEGFKEEEEMLRIVRGEGPIVARSDVAQAPSRLAVRLGLPAEAQIERVSADGHFVEVQTTHGTHRTRLRFSDAIAEVDALDGLIVHRSHWVARDVMVAWVPHPSKPMLLTRCKSKLPISRTYRPAIEALNLPHAPQSEPDTQLTA